MAGAGSDRSDLASLDDALERMAAEQAGTFDAPDDVIGDVRSDLAAGAPSQRMPDEEPGQPASASSIDEALSGVSDDLAARPRSSPPEPRAKNADDAEDALEQLSDDLDRALQDLDGEAVPVDGADPVVESDSLDDVVTAPEPDDPIADGGAPDEKDEGASIDDALAATSEDLDGPAALDESAEAEPDHEPATAGPASAAVVPADAPAPETDQAEPPPGDFDAPEAAPEPEAEQDEPPVAAEEPIDEAGPAHRAMPVAASPTSSDDDLASAFDEVEGPGGEAQPATQDQGLMAAAAAAAAARQANQAPAGAVSPIVRLKGLGMKALMVLNAPFAGMSKQSVDTIGWIALVTLFNAVCLLALVLLR